MALCLGSRYEGNTVGLVLIEKMRMRLLFEARNNQNTIMRFAVRTRMQYNKKEICVQNVKRNDFTMLLNQS